MSYREIKGDLIELTKSGEFDVITHGCNCFCTMGAGIAPQIAKVFGVNSFPLEMEKYKGDINKLGQIDYKKLYLEDTGRWTPYPDENGEWVDVIVTIVNSYTQYKYGTNHLDGDKKPLDYDALTLCLRKINRKFKGLHVGLPQIGCGLAGGDWNIVKGIIQKELKDCQVTVVIYEKFKNEI